jgi:hypothetical protein
MKIKFEPGAFIAGCIVGLVIQLIIVYIKNH